MTYVYEWLERWGKFTREPINVSPTKDQLDVGKWVGEQRFLRLCIEHPNGPDVKRRSAENHMFGARGEMAAALGLEIPWPMRIGTFSRTPDLDPDIEVRSTRSSRGSLYVSKSEPFQERKYVLVVGQSDRFSVVGWTSGSCLERMNTAVNGSGYFVVPQENLARPYTLKLFLHGGNEIRQELWKLRNAIRDHVEEMKWFREHVETLELWHRCLSPDFGED